MPTEKPRITITVTPQQFSRIEDYRFGRKMKNQTQAILSLIEKGLEGDGSAPALPEEALEVARDYQRLDRHGRTVVKVLLSEERRRTEEEARRGTQSLTGEENRVIPLYFTPAAAGYASPAFGEDFEYLEVGGNVPRQADFAVKIDGDSMEPYIMDGSVVYVNRDPLADGDVGIFCVDGNMLCKQYHKDERGVVHLLSLNRDRADADRRIGPDSGVSLNCYGRVILPHRPKLAL